MLKDKVTFEFKTNDSVTGKVLLTSFYKYHLATNGEKYGQCVKDKQSGKLRPICNGCGPAGYGALIPDDILGVCITEAGNVHNWMYQWGEERSDKNVADETFGDNMDRLIRAAFVREVEEEKKRSSLTRWLYLRMAYRAYHLRLKIARDIYTKAVQVWGASAFWDKGIVCFSYDSIGR